MNVGRLGDKLGHQGRTLINGIRSLIGVTENLLSLFLSLSIM